MRDVFIAGTGMTAFGKFPDATLRRLTEEATAEALRDAKASPGDVEIAFFANATAGILTGQEMIRGQVALRNTGILGVPIVNVENACASASSAFYLAHMAVASGQADVALAVGAEKLTHPDKRRTFAAIGTALDLENVVAAREALTRTLLAAGGSDRPDAASPLPLGADVTAGMAVEAAGAGRGRRSWTSTPPSPVSTWSRAAPPARTSPGWPSRTSATDGSTPRRSTAGTSPWTTSSPAGPCRGR
jgi:acetyl-CoA acetyltransferase